MQKCYGIYEIPLKTKGEGEDSGILLLFRLRSGGLPAFTFTGRTYRTSFGECHFDLPFLISAAFNGMLHCQGHFLTGTVIDELVLKIFHAGNRLAVDRGNDIALLQITLGGSASIDDFFDIGADRQSVCTCYIRCDRYTQNSQNTLILCRDLGLALLGLEAVNDRDRLGDRNRKSHTLNGITADLVGIDTDDLSTGVEESAAGIAGVDRCICLDKCTGNPVLTGDLTIQCTDIADCQGLSVSKGIADGNRMLSDPQRIGITQFCNGNALFGLCVERIQRDRNYCQVRTTLRLSAPATTWLLVTIRSSSSVCSMIIPEPADSPSCV